MRSIQLGFGFALLALTLIALPGCAEDNEKGSNITSVGAQGVDGGPPPKTQEEYRKSQMQNNPYAGGSGYPGAK